MSKELFVSTTPHETKVGMVEDDLLAEIYLERENEYTLAGSIYKGRVTRVLPGMQSAFVDIGLERDAFLYVSDFMELEDREDLDDIPTNRPSQERNQTIELSPNCIIDAVATTANARSLRSLLEDPIAPRAGFRGLRKRGKNGTGCRGRRRRRGRRGERMPDSKFARPASRMRSANSERADHAGANVTPRTQSDRSDRPERLARPCGARRPPERSDRQDRSDRSDRERSEYGPPPGYQPIVLPGESISKYRGWRRIAPAPQRNRSSTPQRTSPRRSAEISRKTSRYFAESAQTAKRLWKQARVEAHRRCRIRCRFDIFRMGSRTETSARDECCGGFRETAEEDGR